MTIAIPHEAFAARAALSNSVRIMIPYARFTSATPLFFYTTDTLQPSSPAIENGLLNFFKVGIYDKPLVA